MSTIMIRLLAALGGDKAKEIGVINIPMTEMKDLSIELRIMVAELEAVANKKESK